MKATADPPREATLIAAIKAASEKSKRALESIRKIKADRAKVEGGRP